MEIIIFLSIVIAVVAVLTSIVLVRRVKKQIAEMTDVLVDVKNGNGNRIMGDDGHGNRQIRAGSQTCNDQADQ